MEIIRNLPKSGKFWLPFLVFIFFFAWTRFDGLGDKAYHHDEAQYARESWHYARTGEYRFRPIYHGPLLFHFQAALFSMLPDNDATGRFPSALAGAALVLLAIWALIKIQSPQAALCFLGLFALSPTLAYYSRFLGMDLLILFLGVAFYYSSYLFLKEKKGTALIWSFVLAALMVCTKLNWLFYVFALVTFIPLWMISDPQRKRIGDHLSDAKDILRTAKKPLWIGVALALFVFCALYSSLGRNPKGILDSVGEMIPYWVEQHKQQRIKGDFDYYIYFLLIYELPLVLFWLFQVFREAWKKRDTRVWFQRSLFISACLWAVAAGAWPHLSGFFRLLHIERSWYVGLLCFELLGGGVLVYTHLRQRDILPAFFAHWFAVSLLLYSYAGEKVPWLTTHLVLPLIFYVASTAPKIFSGVLEKRAMRYTFGLLLICTAAWQGLNTFRACFPLSDSPRERLVYTHTSRDIVDLLGRIRNISRVTREGLDVNVQVGGYADWPLWWYLRNYTAWYGHPIAYAKSPYVVVENWEHRDRIRPLLVGKYLEQRFRLREWWVPDETKASLRGVLRYYFFREPFSVLGSQDLVVFVREDILHAWGPYVIE